MHRLGGQCPLGEASITPLRGLHLRSAPHSGCRRARSQERSYLLAAGADGTGVRQARVTFKARNGAQIFGDRSKVAVGHVLKDRPGHDLEKWPKLGMRVIRIDASPHDRLEFFKRSATFRPARVIGSQVAGDEERTKQRSAAGQICRSRSSRTSALVAATVHVNVVIHTMSPAKTTDFALISLLLHFQPSGPERTRSASTPRSMACYTIKMTPG